MASTLQDARYLNLATFRTDGTAVETPVWFAESPEAGVYFVFSAGDAGKVKRLRRSDEARVAPCDVRGKLLGAWQPARAGLVLDESGAAAALAALRRKYGWLMWLTDCLARLSGRYGRRAYIRVTVQ
jgi:PPOX class probable F420-dependent enzyme